MYSFFILYLFYSTYSTKHFMIQEKINKKHVYNFSYMHLRWNENTNKKKKDMGNTCMIAHTCISKATEIKKMKKHQKPK